MNEKDNEKKESSILRTINSILMVVISLILGYVMVEIKDLRTVVNTHDKEIVRLDTNQKSVMESIKVMADKQDKILENQAQILESLKQWTDQNYIRKPQK